MTMLDIRPTLSLDVREREEEDSDLDESIPWLCEIKVQPHKTPCPNEPEWVGHFACGCLAAVCTPHREEYDRTIAAISGPVVVTCTERHGKVGTTRENAVRWSSL